MSNTIEFFFDFVSPFGWFAAERIGGIARAHGRNVAWKPLLLGVTVKRVMGLPALLETPLKGPYLLHDAERCARFHGLPWRPPTPIMFSSVAAARAIMWAVARGDLDVEPLVLGLYRRAWTMAGDISTPDAVADLAAAQGFDRAALRAGIECPETKAGLRRSVADAAGRGIFGSPFIVVDGEPFWGADRLEMVERWLVSPW
ncbi:MAG: 2-hydroxychromene-2-carboxylate isomerase [Alphaproteobacteria bacterium]|nr:2-hydroxychromene-2-carboxylate isomerase [Alphaproteobacteria bacterium]